MQKKCTKCKRYIQDSTLLKSNLCSKCHMQEITRQRKEQAALEDAEIDALQIVLDIGKE